MKDNVEVQTCGHSYWFALKEGKEGAMRKGKGTKISNLDLKGIDGVSKMEGAGQTNMGKDVELNV